MINCLSWDDKRGFVVLNSKEIRNLKHFTFNYGVNLACIKDYLEQALKEVRTHNYGKSETCDYNPLEHKLETSLEWLEEMAKYHEKTKDILR